MGAQNGDAIVTGYLLDVDRVQKAGQDRTWFQVVEEAIRILDIEHMFVR